MIQKNKIAILGAGRLGKGFLGAEFLKSGWNVDFYDNDSKVIENLEKGEFIVEMHATNKTYIESYQGYMVYDINDNQALQHLLMADVIAIDTYPQDVSKLFPLMRQFVEYKITHKEKVSIIIFTNKTDFTLFVKEGIQESLSEKTKQEFSKYIEVRDAIIIRSTFASSNADLNLQSIAVTNSIVETLAYNDISMVSGMRESDKVPVLKKLKIFTLNGPHSALAYSGYYKGHKTINDAEKDAFCKEIANGIAVATQLAIHEEYHLTENDLKEISISKPAKDPILDSVQRVGCNPIRKLAFHDRLVYPAVLALKHNIDFSSHAKAIALGLLYDDQNDMQAIQIQSYLKEFGIKKTIMYYCGLDYAHEKLMNAIVQAYEELSERKAKNNKKIYQIDPILEDRIWGGRSLIKMFDLDTDLPNVAEIYSVIAIPNHLDCNVQGINIPLSEFYEKNRELFGCNVDYLPVRMVIGNQIAPLSVQIHPNDDYGLKHGGMRGKPESEWLLGDGEGYMILGHHAKSKEEFIDLVEKEEWDALFRKVDVRGGDFIDIPQGTLHGSAGEGVCVAFSTNGDVTYRLYDYDRVGKNGKPRELHINHVIENVIIPDDKKFPVTITEVEKNGCKVSDFLDKRGLYTCGKIAVEDKGTFGLDEFYFLLCVEGSGTINDKEIKAGVTLFIPCKFGDITIAGNLLLAYISFKDK